MITSAETVVVLTGAGISAESGVPTFRGPDGLWQSFRAEELATPAAFDRDPRLVWEWYSWRRERIAACVPNAAHMALARFALRRPNVRIITQNVDGLHALAAVSVAEGADPQAAMPLDLHGSIFRDRCTMCAFQRENRSGVDASSLATLPRCEQCGALLRPDVVWFGEPLGPGVMEEAFEWAGRADVCLVVGTSGVVEPAASIASTTRATGGKVIEVNTEETSLTRVANMSIRGKAAEVVPPMLS
jgi:NAD-dependent deacetylase